MVEGELAETRQTGARCGSTRLEEVVDEVAHPLDRGVRLLKAVPRDVAAVEARSPRAPEARLAGPWPVITVDVVVLLIDVRVVEDDVAPPSSMTRREPKNFSESLRSRSQPALSGTTTEPRLASPRWRVSA
jgi:hypothetical protein